MTTAPGCPRGPSPRDFGNLSRTNPHPDNTRRQPGRTRQPAGQRQQHVAGLVLSGDAGASLRVILGRGDRC